MWQWVRADVPPDEIERFVRTIVGAEKFSQEAEDTAFKSLLKDEDEQRLLWYGAFAIEHLYLGSSPLAATGRSHDSAARLARFLVRFWEAEAGQGNARAAIALPMARRAYWRALRGVVQAADGEWAHHNLQAESFGSATAQLTQKVKRTDAAWLIGWLEAGELREEYLRALRAWQAICIDDHYASFFMQILSPWLGYDGHDWQRLREDELNRTIWLDPWPGFAEHGDEAAGTPPGRAWTLASLRARLARGLFHGCPPTIRTATTEDQAMLRHVIEHWYLPRYDLARAAQLRAAVVRAEARHGSRPERWSGWLAERLIRFKWGPHGAVRLWASIGAGYLLTGLTPDLWEMLDTMVSTHPWRAPWLLLGLPALSLGYLVYGLRHKTGLGSGRVAAGRALNLWLRGQVFALAAGLVLGAAAAAVQVEGFAIWSGSGLAVVVAYAQITVAFAIFVQLLFDDKPATAPLAAP